MPDLKLYGKSGNEIKGLVSTVDIFIQDIGMEFGTKKCGVIIMNKGKVKATDGGKIREIEGDEYKYLGILEYEREKEQEMKDKFRNEYFRREKLILKCKLNGMNKIMALNTWAVSILRYGAGMINWNKNELQEMARKNGRRRLIGCENSVKSEENGLGWNIKNNPEPLLVVGRISGTTTDEETVYPKEFKKTKEEQRKNEWTAKTMNGKFARDMENKDANDT